MAGPSSAERRKYLGIDVGTTQVKGGLFDARGALLAGFSRPCPTDRPGPGLVEQDPADWLAALDAGIAELTRGTAPGEIAALGLCAQVNTDVFVDADGRPLLPAIVWQDLRATAEAEELAAGLTPEEIARWWGGSAAPIGASHVLARMLWLSRGHPELWARCAQVLAPRDFCLRHLTGRAISDPVSAWAVAAPRGGYLQGLLARLPGAAQRLPPLLPMTAVMGETPIGGRRVPVVAGTMDAFANLLGCGVSRPGQAMYMSGTSEILALSAERGGAEGIVTFPRAAGMVVHAAPTQSGGDSLRWWGQVAGVPALEIPALAARADRNGRPLLFLPHLAGERAPLWDSSLRGAFLGLDAAARGPDFALALLEGVALSARLALGPLTRAAGFAPDRFLYGGGGARSDLWSQIRADCLGLPLHRVAHPDVGCLGAAILAAVGTGGFADLGEAARAMTATGRIFTPDPALAPRYDRLFAAFSAATAALRPIGGMLQQGPELPPVPVPPVPAGDLPCAT